MIFILNELSPFIHAIGLTHKLYKLPRAWYSHYLRA